MRTIIDLNNEQIQKLDEIRASENVSRTELIRRAVDSYLEAHDPQGQRMDHSFFGKYPDLPDGLTYQKQIRGEWDRGQAPPIWGLNDSAGE